MSLPLRVLTVVPFLAAACGKPPAPEPSFEGKSLSHWAEALRQSTTDGKDESTDTRRSPFALSRIGEPALPAIESLLGHRRPQVRQRAIAALMSMGPRAAPAAPALVPLLKDREASVRQATAMAIATLRIPEELALPALLAALQDPEPRVRAAAATALGSLGQAETTPALERATHDSNAGVRTAAKAALHQFQARSAPSPPPRD